MYKKKWNQFQARTNRDWIVRVACACMLAAALPPLAQSAERDICENMTGEQLRRCIEASTRGQPAQPQRPPATPASSPGKSGPAAVAPPSHTISPAQPVVPPPAPGPAATEQSKELQRRDCTKVPQPDQALCIHRNTALLECANRGKHPDQGKCLDDIMSRAPNPAIADCRRLPESQQAGCARRNNVYAACKGDKLNYFACLDARMAGKK